MVGDESSSTEYQRLAAQFERAGAEEVVAWAVERFGRRLSLVCSFQNCVLIDLVTRVDPKVDVIFLDTGAHFPETMTYVERVETQYQLKLRVITPEADADRVAVRIRTLLRVPQDQAPRARPRRTRGLDERSQAGRQRNEGPPRPSSTGTSPRGW